MNDINAVDSEGRTLLMHTLMHGFYEAVELLLDNPELDCNIIDNKGLNALMHACRFPYIKYVKLIADRTDDLNYQCKELNNDSAVHMAINGFRNILVIDSSISKKIACYVAYTSSVTTASELIMHKGLVLGKREDNYCYNDELALSFIKYLLNKEADCNLKNNQGLTPFRLACFSKMNYLANNLKNISGLVADEEANLISFNSMNWITLGENIEHAQELLKTGLININYQDEDGYTLLHHACLNNRLVLLEYLISMNADPNIPNKPGYYPIHSAAEANHFEIVKNYCLKKLM